MTGGINEKVSSSGAYAFVGKWSGKWISGKWIGTGIGKYIDFSVLLVLNYSLGPQGALGKHLSFGGDSRGCEQLACF